MSTHNRISSVTIVGGGSAGWMAAAALATYLGKGTTIRLVESEEIGIVGVGEASVPHMKLFNGQWLGIDEAEFVKRTQATAKLGIQFNDWARIGDSYFHGFGAIGKSIGPLPFHQFWLKLFLAGQAGPIGDYSPQTVMAPRGKFAPGDRGASPQSPLADIAYAYHFDASLYARHLRKLSEARGVERIEGKIVQVSQRAHDGFVDAVVLESGQRVEGDLFIDCSGFRGLLIEQTLHAGFEDWSHWLPCDRALAVPCESAPVLTPYTRATAHGAGWQWRIPLQNRIGNGHVYCSRHISDDEAAATLLANLDGKPLADPRPIRFTTGMRKKAWVKNVVALGLASGFLEPLESTSIHMVQSGVQQLLDFFPDRGFSQVDIDAYNDLTRFHYERIRDFIILHYHANQRDDSAFWKACANMAIPDTLREKLDLFRSHGRIQRYNNELFTEVGWLQVLVGQNIHPQAYHPLVDVQSEEGIHDYMDSVADVVRQCVDFMPDHAAFIAGYCKAPAQ